MGDRCELTAESLLRAVRSLKRLTLRDAIFPALNAVWLHTGPDGSLIATATNRYVMGSVLLSSVSPDLCGTAWPIDPELTRAAVSASSRAAVTVGFVGDSTVYANGEDITKSRVDAKSRVDLALVISRCMGGCDAPRADRAGYVPDNVRRVLRAAAIAAPHSSVELRNEPGRALTIHARDFLGVVIPTVAAGLPSTPWTLTEQDGVSKAGA